MAIRIREVGGKLVALCAARSMPKDGDLYLDDAAHHALSEKFSRDLGLTADTDPVVEREESNNPNREWWNTMYGEKPKWVVITQRYVRHPSHDTR